MPETAKQRAFVSRESYLSIEDRAEHRGEYYDGEIVAMAGGSSEHSIICVNMNRRLAEYLDEKECFVFDGNLKLDISAYNHFVYPDVMVVCGDIEFYPNRTDIVQNPVLVIEVLSSATRSFDRGDKFAYYRSVLSIREYALISQDEPMAEVFFKQNEKTWLLSITKGIGDEVMFRSLNIKLPMKDIYQKIKWKQGSVLV